MDSASGKVRLPSYDGPGQYVVVARAQRGSYSTPWSPPVTVTLVAPFDLSSVSSRTRVARATSSAGIVREKAIAGSRVTVAAAKGKKGKRFRTLGKGRVNSQGVFKVRFRLSRGTYRIRYSFSGNSVGHQGHRLRDHHDSPGDPLARTQRRRYSRRSITVVRVPAGARPSSHAGNHALAYRFIGAVGTPLVHVRRVTPSTVKRTRPAPQAIS